MESTSFWIAPEVIYSLQCFPKSVKTYGEQSACGLSALRTNPFFFNWAIAFRMASRPIFSPLGTGMRPSLSAAKITSLSKRVEFMDISKSSARAGFCIWGVHPICKAARAWEWLAMSLEACPTCGYAVSTTIPRCHHCHGAPEESPPAQNFNAVSPVNFLLFWIVSMSLIFILLNWS